MKLVQQAIGNVFPDCDASALTLETKLSELPDWDSMNAINLIMEIEALSGRQNLALQFGPDITVGQLVEMLRAHGLNV